MEEKLDNKRRKPNYNFEIQDGVARGYLSNGTPFLIDEDKVELVSQRFFHLDGKGYLCSRDGEKRNNRIKLHWLVLGYTDSPGYLVDHINRDKTDCRISNLRFVTNQQNSCNRKMSISNTSGYKGVFFVKKIQKYTARIGYKMKAKNIFYSNDPIECAKAYNYAADILFREYAGYRNPVDEADDAIKKQVYEICSATFLDLGTA